MNTDTIPCASKKRVEVRATEELCSISEKGTVLGWRKAKSASVESFHTALQENREDLGSLMHKILVTKNDNTRLSSSKAPLCSWQVCLSAKQHQGGYLDPDEECLLTKTNVAFGKKRHLLAPPRCHRSNLTKENSDENNCFEGVTVEEARAQSASYVDQNNGHIQDGGKISRNSRSASCSPHPAYKFHHSSYIGYHIKSYQEQVTNDGIKKHIFSRLKESKKFNSEKISPQKTYSKPVVKSIAIPKAPFTLYRFRISKDKSSGDSSYLKVGPCPRMAEQTESKKADVKIASNAKTCEKRKELANMAPTATDKGLGYKRKEIKTAVTCTPLKFKNTPLLQRESVHPQADSEANAKDTFKTETSEGGLKKVQLRVHSPSDSPRIVPKSGGRVNRTKVCFDITAVLRFCFFK